MNLLEQILDNDSLDLACLKVIREKGANGVDKMSIMDLRNYLEQNRETLKSSIRSRAYKPQPVRLVEILKDDGIKQLLRIPTVIDRMIQQAIVQVLSPIYEESFSEHSFGFRLKRNAHMAIAHTLEIINQGKEWIR